MMNRAYSLLDIKQVNDEQRVITGIATTPSPDRMGDVVEPLGVKFKNPLPLLWQHRSDQPVGTVRFDKPTKDGITFQAKMPKIAEPGPLKDRVDTAWGEVKAGLVRAVSIGFRDIEFSRLESGGLRFIESEVLELSLVTIPANADATIHTIKSIDAKAMAASGRRIVTTHGVDLTPAGVTARKSTPVVKATKMPTIKERIADFEASRAAKAAQLNAIQELVAEEGRTKSDDERENFDTLTSEIESIDRELVDLAKMEKLNLVKAVVAKGDDVKSAAAARAGISVSVKQKEVPPGIPFTRYVIALARAKGNLMVAREIAQNNEQWAAETPEVADVLRAAVAAGTTTDSTWAGPLVNYQILTSEFIEYLRPATIIGRIPGLTRVPFKVKIPRQTGGATVAWVGEGQVKPLSALAFDTVTLEEAKIAGIIAITDELVRRSEPAAEALVRNDLAKAIVEFMDAQFVDPTVASTGISPASVTNGVTPVTATGTTAAALRTDINTLASTFLTNNLSLAGGVWIMTESQALAISLMQTSLGTPAFPGITPNGGTLVGLPVITSENIPATGGSPVDGYAIILMKPNEVLLADDGQVTIDASREASLQMSDSPDSPVSASTTLLSMFQHNMVAIKAERYINWGKRRSTAVGFIQNAKYKE